MTLAGRHIWAYCGKPIKLLRRWVRGKNSLGPEVGLREVPV